MSLKTNALITAAAGLAGVTVAGSPVVEMVLNDSAVTSATVFGVDKTGRCAIAVDVAVNGGASAVRVVAGADGAARTYANASAAMAAVRRAAPNINVEYVPFVVVASLSDPLKTLIAKHKAAKTEAQKALAALSAPQTGITAKIAVAESLGWDTAAAGTLEANEYADMVVRQTSISEWSTRAAALVTQYTQSLTDAGIDPVTYLPV